MSQKYITNLIQNYDKFVSTIKDKYTSICKTKLVDRYGDYVVNYAMVNYPGVKDIYQKEEVMLLKQKRMPFGKFKGKNIDDMEESYIKEFFKMKSFKQNPSVRKTFRKTKFRDLMKSESEYKDMMVPTKTSKSKVSKDESSKSRGAIKKRKQTRRKRGLKKTFYYFYMGGCHWCEKFNSTWTRLVKQYGNKFIMKEN